MKTRTKKSIHRKKTTHSASRALKADGRIFRSPRDYFEHVCEATGYPTYFKKFTEETIQSENTRLHLDIYESGKNHPTLIFIPDAVVYALCYGEFLYKLGKQGYNVIGIDMRGHGRSEGTRGDFTITQLLADIINTITFAIERYNNKVSLAGSGLGGILSLYIATLDHRLCSVICHNIADLTAPETRKLAKHPKLAKFLAITLKLSSDDKKLPLSLFTGDLHQYEIPYFGNVKNFLVSDPLVLKSITIRAIKSIAFTDIPAPVEKIKVPVMAISGTDDHVFPVEYTRWLYDRIPSRKQLHFCEGLDHFMFYKNTDLILPPVLKWLKEIHQ